MREKLENCFFFKHPMKRIKVILRNVLLKYRRVTKHVRIILQKLCHPIVRILRPTMLPRFLCQIADLVSSDMYKKVRVKKKRGTNLTHHLEQPEYVD